MMQSGSRGRASLSAYVHCRLNWILLCLRDSLAWRFGSSLTVGRRKNSPGPVAPPELTRSALIGSLHSCPLHVLAQSSNRTSCFSQVAATLEYVPCRHLQSISISLVGVDPSLARSPPMTLNLAEVLVRHCACCAHRYVRHIRLWNSHSQVAQNGHRA